MKWWEFSCESEACDLHKDHKSALKVIPLDYSLQNKVYVS